MTTPHDEAMLELASLHGLGLVPNEECASIDEHMKHCDECRAAFAESAALGAGLAWSAAETPPVGLRARVMRAVAPARSVAPATNLERARPSRSWWIPAGVLAAAAVVLAILTHGFRFTNQTTVALHSPAGRVTAIRAWPAKCTLRPCTASANVVALSTGTMQLRAVGLQQLPPGKIYQAWIIPPTTKKPLPEPTFKPDRLGNGEVEFPGTFVRGMLVAVTVEPAGGSKAPTSAPLLVAALN